MGVSSSCSKCNSSKQEPELELSTNNNILSEACEELRLALDTKDLAEDPRLCYASLTVASSPHLREGDSFEINPLGYEFTKREFKDGVVFFGDCRREILENGHKGEIINDISLKSEHRAPGRHFMISYNWDSNYYFVQDLGAGLGVFRKLHSPVPIKANMLISCAGLFVLFDTSEGELKCSLFSKSLQQVHRFSDINFVLRNVTIGRSSSCDIAIDDPLISKVQASILRRADQWVLVDGNANSKKPSKNGTWLYISEKFRLLNGMKLKTGDSIFDVKVYNKS